MATSAFGRGGEIDPGSPIRKRCGELVFELGERTTLLGHGELGLSYFPDQGVSTLRRSPLRLLVAAKFSTCLVEGPDIRSLAKATEVLPPGGPGDFDNGYAGVGGVYEHRDGRLHAFYHAEDWQGLPSFPVGIRGFYASVGVAVSSDSGATWKKLGPGITSAKPKSWQAFDGHAGRGAGFPTAVTDFGRRNLLLYYNDLSHVDGRGVQVDFREPAKPAGRVSGLYVAASRDGISWSEPCKLFSDRAFPERGEFHSRAVAADPDRSVESIRGTVLASSAGLRGGAPRAVGRSADADP